MHKRQPNSPPPSHYRIFAGLPLMKPRNKQGPRIEEIEKVVVTVYKVSHEEIHSRRRNGRMVKARSVIWYLYDKLNTGATNRMSLNKMAAYFGHFSHCTVMYGIKRIATDLEIYPEVRNEIRQIKKALSR